MSHWLLIVGVIAVAAIGITLAVVLSARARQTANAERDGEGLGLVRFVAVLAGIAAFVSAFFTLIGVVAILAGQAAAVDIPVLSYLPTLPSGVTDVVGPTAQITGGADQLTLTVGDLSVGTRVILALSQLLGGATFVTIALLVRRLARSAISADAYRGVASRTIGAAAIVLAVGSFASSILGQLAGWFAGSEALQISSYTATGPAGEVLSNGSDGAALQVFGWPTPSFALNFDFTPLLIALALGCIAAVFREGERLRVRAEAAEADVKGLI